MTAKQRLVRPTTLPIDALPSRRHHTTWRQGNATPAGQDYIHSASYPKLWKSFAERWSECDSHRVGVGKKRVRLSPRLATWSVARACTRVAFMIYMHQKWLVLPLNNLELERLNMLGCTRSIMYACMVRNLSYRSKPTVIVGQGICSINRKKSRRKQRR